LLTFVSGTNNNTKRSIAKVTTLNRSRVPEILSLELARIGPIWFTIITPNQNPVLVTDTMNPEVEERSLIILTT